MLPQDNLMANVSYTIIFLSNKLNDADAKIVSGDHIKVSDFNQIMLAHYMPVRFLSPKYSIKEKTVDVF